MMLLVLLTLCPACFAQVPLTKQDITPIPIETQHAQEPFTHQAMSALEVEQASITNNTSTDITFSCSLDGSSWNTLTIAARKSQLISLNPSGDTYIKIITHDTAVVHILRRNCYLIEWNNSKLIWDLFLQQ